MTADAHVTGRTGAPANRLDLRWILQLAGLALLIGLLSWASIEVPREIGRPAPIWPANALVLSILLVSPPRRWTAWLVSAWVGSVAANFASGGGLPLSLSLAVCNSLEVALSAVLLRRFVGPVFDVTRVRDLARLFLLAGVLSPAIAALGANLLLAQVHGAVSLANLMTWAAADGVGVMIIVPLVLTLRDIRQHLVETPMTAGGWMALAAVAAVSLFVFYARQPVLFLIAPAVLLAVFRMEVLGAALAVLVVAAARIIALSAGHMPMEHLQIALPDRMIIGQLFLAALTLTSFTTAAVLAHRRRFEARYRLLAESATDVILKVDCDDVINYVSPSARRYGYEPESLYGVSGYSLVHPDDLPKVQAIIADLFTGADVDTARDRTYRIRTAAGDYVWMEGNPAIVRDERGAPIAVVSQLRDVTQRMAMEAELEAALAAAETAAGVKADFLANMSHELRTPLTAVLGFTRLALEQPGLGSVARGYIAKASSAGEALQTTVNDILDFSKLESGRLQIRPVPCDAGDVCRATLELFSVTAAAKGVALRFEGGVLPPHVRLDPDRLRQVLLNLISNAVKFSEGGEVLLSVGWRAADKHLLVSVKDDGPGITAEQQSLLFRRFSQIDGSATRRHGGTGLGLAICRGLIDAMDGEIGVESGAGAGARFFFELPAEPCAPQAAGVADAAAFPVGARVLVADDHVVNRELVRAILTPLGAQVSEAADGREAATAAARSPFDVILMDLRMPELDGVAAMRAIREAGGPNRKTPILAFSAGADVGGAAERRRAGFDGDLAKPLLPAELIAAVARHARPASSGKARKPRPRRAAKA